MNKIIFLNTIDSTNNYIKANLSTLADRTIVIAKYQTAGRGRFNRTFISDVGGLYMSVLLKNFSTDLLTVCAGVSVADVLNDLRDDTKVKIKWVNDVLCEDKKVCGILAEVVSGCAVIGIGVNIKHSESLPDTASSLEKLYDINIDTITLADLIINKLFNYIDNDNFNPQLIINRYRHYTSYLIGQQITYNSGEGTVLLVTDNGNLMIKNPAGEGIILHSGEISIKFKKELL